MKKSFISIIIFLAVVFVIFFSAKMFFYEIYLTMKPSQESLQLVHKAVQNDFVQSSLAIDKLNTDSEKFKTDLKQIAKIFYLRVANREIIEKTDEIKGIEKSMLAGTEAEMKFKLCIYLLKKNNHMDLLQELHEELQSDFWFGEKNSPELIDYLNKEII